MPSVLWRSSFGGRKGIQPVKSEWCNAGVVMCLGQGADLCVYVQSLWSAELYWSVNVIHLSVFLFLEFEELAVLLCFTALKFIFLGGKVMRMEENILIIFCLWLLGIFGGCYKVWLYYQFVCFVCCQELCSVLVKFSVYCYTRIYELICDVECCCHHLSEILCMMLA